MRNYEVMFILKPADDVTIEQGIEKAKKCILDNAGEIKKIDLWGKKRLAYTIDSMTEGVYVLINFIAGGKNTVVELDRMLRIDEESIRHMIVAKG